MAAPYTHVGHSVQRNGRLLLRQLQAHRMFGWTSAVRQQAAEAKKEQEIIIPKKKTWSKVAVLEALASTVDRDLTAYPYQFQDDPFLSPKSGFEFRLFTIGLESGREAAKYFVNNNSNFFTKDFAEPHIPCFMPETVTERLEEVSEEALKERINLKKVKAAVDMFDELQKTGTAVSMETVHNLLDLICFYCDEDPFSEEPEAPQDEVPESTRYEKSRLLIWKENNNAERIFNLLPERDLPCYSALIRGMVKHGAHAQAFSFYTDLQNNRLTADIHIFNALILAAPSVRELHVEKWNLIEELLKQMNEQKIRPNLQTFNNTLKALRECGPMTKGLAIQVFNEMKAVGIAPSLASYRHYLELIYKAGKFLGRDMLQKVVSELKGTSITCRDPEDVMFFSSAMQTCWTCKDLELAYELNSLLDEGDNWRLLGNNYNQQTYYLRFFNVLCSLEYLEEVMKWYKLLIPSKFYLNPLTLRSLMQVLDTENRLDLLPTIWIDVKIMGLERRMGALDELLEVMAREEHNAEVQNSLADCALEMKNILELSPHYEWSASVLTDLATLMLRANRFQEAWEVLQLFKSENRVPRETLLNSFLTICCTEAKPRKAVELVQLSAAFCLSGTAKLADRALAELTLTEEQRYLLTALGTSGQPERDDHQTA